MVTRHFFKDGIFLRPTDPTSGLDEEAEKMFCGNLGKVELGFKENKMAELC